MKTLTRLRSTAARTFASATYLELMRDKARLKRRLLRLPPMVHYFRQVDDPYSHLAVQKLDQLKAAYRLPFHVHLVSKPATDYLGSSELFDDWAARDALSVAADYGVSFSMAHLPEAPAVRTANDALAAHLDRDHFARAATEVGAALWAGSAFCGTRNQRSGEGAVHEGNALRRKRGHYAGADIEWGALQRAADGTDWQAVLNDNLNVMLDCGLWGVPSFRVSGGNAATAFACWGQDRIWRVENEIGRRT